MTWSHYIPWQISEDETVCINTKIYKPMSQYRHEHIQRREIKPGQARPGLVYWIPLTPSASASPRPKPPGAAPGPGARAPATAESPPPAPAPTPPRPPRRGPAPSRPPPADAMEAASQQAGAQLVGPSPFTRTGRVVAGPHMLLAVVVAGGRVAAAGGVLMWWCGNLGGRGEEGDWGGVPALQEEDVGEQPAAPKAQQAAGDGVKQAQDKAGGGVQQAQDKAAELQKTLEVKTRGWREKAHLVVQLLIEQAHLGLYLLAPRHVQRGVKLCRKASPPQERSLWKRSAMLARLKVRPTCCCCCGACGGFDLRIMQWHLSASVLAISCSKQ